MARRPWVALCVGAALGAAACGGTLDAGRDRPHGLLPVDERNPVILDNDQSSDNWVGEYAMLLANSGGPPIAGIIASASSYWPVASDNAAGWTRLVTAARASGLENIPDVTMSDGLPLVRPADGQIDSTTGNQSAGGRLIVELSRQLSLPWRPVVVLACAPLTTVADAYLQDPSVVDRVVVVAVLGAYAAPNGIMNGPNGDLDPWADWIVAQRFRYVQVSAYYDQLGDVTPAELASLPQMRWARGWRTNSPTSSRSRRRPIRLRVLSVALPTFAIAVQRVSPDTSVAFDSMQGPPLRPDVAGNAWIVTQSAAPLAKSRLWDMLLDPRTYGP